MRNLWLVGEEFGQTVREHGLLPECRIVEILATVDNSLLNEKINQLGIPKTVSSRNLGYSYSKVCRGIFNTCIRPLAGCEFERDTCRCTVSLLLGV